MAAEREWLPEYFEWSFGLSEHNEGRDPRSLNDPVTLDGRFVLRELARYGIDTSHVARIGGQSRTSLAVVETRAEDCQSVIYRNDAADLRLSDEVIQSFKATYGRKATKRLNEWQQIMQNHVASAEETKREVANEFFNRIPWLTDDEAFALIGLNLRPVLREPARALLAAGVDARVSTPAEFQARIGAFLQELSQLGWRYSVKGAVQLMPRLQQLPR